MILLITDVIILNIVEQMGSTGRLLELFNEFAEVSANKMNTKRALFAHTKELHG